MFRGFAVGLGLMLAANVAMATSYVTQQAQVIGIKGSTVDVTASCPGGYTPVGGGYDMPDAVNSVFVTNVVQSGGIVGATGANYFIPGIVVSISRPSDDGAGWRVAGFVNKPIAITAFVRCASLN